ncbi:hypothetical protein I302_108914 [Kwoniella bestiolae CBS 10118]|uniref:Uncharacterized protein n=1 Tax=Kwoniella bestiolae CBS 10118 TaxID=1296100 RepID=A0A1B9FUG8_9TREE|nr:hypothetical protein I302_08054 [Kwoniella bestiolae CBS 10118]OCF22406.1 hypothetical protein I302_08054 [Kwoniella bestiolae CBS 10118]
MLNAANDDSSSEENDTSFTNVPSSPALLSFVNEDTQSAIPYWNLPPVSERFKMIIGNTQSRTQTEGRSRTDDWLDEVMTHEHPAYQFDCTVDGSPGTGECYVTDESELCQGGESGMHPVLKELRKRNALEKVETFSVYIEPIDTRWPERSLRHRNIRNAHNLGEGTLVVDLMDDDTFGRCGDFVNRQVNMTFIPGSATTLAPFKDEESVVNDILLSIFKDNKITLEFDSTIELDGEVERED